MIKKLIILATITIFVVSCAQNTSNSNQTSANSSGEIKQGVQPIADNEVAVFEMENPDAYGSFTMELYSNIAPETVAQFKSLAREGFYNGTSFHRIDKNLGIVQGGDPNSKDNDPSNDGIGNSTKPNVPAEFSDIPFDTGIVGAARRGNDVNSQNSQFFIMTKRQPAFDKQYTVFGKVVDGMDNVRVIGGADTEDSHPLGKITIKSVKIVPKGQTK